MSSKMTSMSNIASKFRLSFLFGIALLLAATAITAGQTGIKAKKPVFGGACKLCPWGAMAEVVKEAMQPYGYNVQICYNCNAADAPRIVSEARTPPPYKPDPAVPEILARGMPRDSEPLTLVRSPSTSCGRLTVERGPTRRTSLTLTCV
jgi:hypothetical protein